MQGGLRIRAKRKPMVFLHYQRMHNVVYQVNSVFYYEKKRYY